LLEDCAAVPVIFVVDVKFICSYGVNESVDGCLLTNNVTFSHVCI